jgi:hypothetical protein
VTERNDMEECEEDQAGEEQEFAAPTARDELDRMATQIRSIL